AAPRAPRGRAYPPAMRLVLLAILCGGCLTPGYHPYAGEGFVCQSGSGDCDRTGGGFNPASNREHVDVAYCAIETETDGGGNSYTATYCAVTHDQCNRKLSAEIAFMREIGGS